jgi:competence protein ComEA
MKKLLVMLFACFAFAASSWAAVDLNSANQAQLESVNGIGPVKAKAIIEYRTKKGPFKSVDDLEKVNGFGKKTVDKVRAEVTVGGATLAPMDKKAKAEDKKAKPDDKKEKSK